MYEKNPRKRDKQRKPLKDTALFKWAAEKWPGAKVALDRIAHVVADATGIDALKDLIIAEPSMPMTTADQLELRRLAAQEFADWQAEISDRWEADMASDSWLSKNVRPLVVLALVSMLVVFIILDSSGVVFAVSEEWQDIFKMALETVIIAYFGSRGVEKVQEMRTKATV